MNRSRHDRTGEALIEWGAAALLAAAVGWSAAMVGNSPLIGAATLVALLPLAVAVMKWIDRETAAQLNLSEFALPPITPQDEEELLLDDPLVEVTPDSRISSLFEAEPATPGAMVARIADYLGERSPHARPAADEADGPVAADAGAALHAALANIRASLR